MALERLTELDGLAADWQAGRLRETVLANPAYQQECGTAA
jgi:hypothetical protein